MSYQVSLENQASRELLELPKVVREKLAFAIDDLAQNPRPPGAKKLTGYEGYRVRKGDYRVLYTIHDKEKMVRIYRVGHRREIYR